MLVLVFIGCEKPTSVPLPAEPSSDALNRIDVEATPASAVPSCALLASCPQEGVDATACLDDPALFDVTLLDGAVSSIALDPEAVIPAGTWFTAFPDPTGGCGLTLFSFRGSP